MGRVKSLYFDQIARNEEYAGDPQYEQYIAEQEYQQYLASDEHIADVNAELAIVAEQEREHNAVDFVM